MVSPRVEQKFHNHVLIANSSWLQEHGDKHMLGTVLLVILILLLIGALPNWGHSRNWGYGPSGGLGLVVLIIIILLLMGRI
jgi:hypothetical protein